MNTRHRSNHNHRPRPASRKSSVLARFQAIYLSVVVLTLIFIIIFSFLIKGRINQILGMNTENGRPDFEIFAYHSVGTTEEEEDEEDSDEDWPDADDYDLGDLPPVPRVPAAPAQAPGNVTQATTPTAAVTENNSQTSDQVTSPPEETQPTPPPTSPGTSDETNETVSETTPEGEGESEDP